MNLFKKGLLIGISIYLVGVSFVIWIDKTECEKYGGPFADRTWSFFTGCWVKDETEWKQVINYHEGNTPEVVRTKSFEEFEK